jgi:hypothetical protein
MSAAATLPVFPAAIVLLAAPAFAHRLDEYLQAAILSVETNRIQVQMTLTPGVSVYSRLIENIDTDADGIVSDGEQHAYAARVLQDVSLAVDGHRLTPRLRLLRFPSVEEMKEGRGEIQLDFFADLPPGGGNRKLTFENRHRAGISAYQVNCLVPRDANIRIAAQERNYTQSFYRLDYVQTGVPSGPSWTAWSAGRIEWLGAVAVLLFTALVFFWPRRQASVEAPE